MHLSVSPHAEICLVPSLILRYVQNDIYFIRRERNNQDCESNRNEGYLVQEDCGKMLQAFFLHHSISRARCRIKIEWIARRCSGHYYDTFTFTFSEFYRLISSSVLPPGNSATM